MVQEGEWRCSLKRWMREHKKGEWGELGFESDVKWHQYWNSQKKKAKMAVR